MPKHMVDILGREGAFKNKCESWMSVCLTYVSCYHLKGAFLQHCSGNASKSKQNWKANNYMGHTCNIVLLRSHQAMLFSALKQTRHRSLHDLSIVLFVWSYLIFHGVLMTAWLNLWLNWHHLIYLIVELLNDHCQYSLQQWMCTHFICTDEHQYLSHLHIIILSPLHALLMHFRDVLGTSQGVL